MKKSVTAFIVFAVVFALMALACFIYQSLLTEPTATNAALRALTYNGFPVCTVLAAISAVIAIILKIKK